jgi:hypothetical protein
MTTIRFNSLGSFAAHLLTIEADLKLTEEVCVEKACRMVEKEAKTAIGTYRFDWPPLQPETVARKARLEGRSCACGQIVFGTTR